MKTSSKGIDLIKSHEGLKLLAYDDFQPNKIITNAVDVKGTLTIGYGHTASVFVGQRISAKYAEELLISDIKWAEKVVNNAMENQDIKLSQSRFDMMVSWIYNTGNGKHPLQSRSAWKQLLRLIKAEEDFRDIYTKYYITSKGKLMQGLVNRRFEEMSIILCGYD